MFLVFLEGYRTLIINMKQELGLTDASNYTDAIASLDDTENYEITLWKILWRVTHVSVDIPHQLALSKQIKFVYGLLVPISL